jgi:integrase
LAAVAAMPAQLRSNGDEPNYKARPTTNEAKRARQASANRVLTMLRAALNHAYDEDHVSNNDAWGRKLKMFHKVATPRVNYLSIAEAQRLLNAATPDFRSLARAALETGCRYGELTQLQVQDYNPDAGTVHVRMSKSGKSRHVVLTDEGADFFRAHCAGRSRTDLMFTRGSGAPWLRSQQQERKRATCKHARLTPVGFHQLRHTWASLAVMNGMPLMVVAKNLGHRDTRMVELHYGHLAPSFIVDAIRTSAPRYGMAHDAGVVPLRPRRR